MTRLELFYDLVFAFAFLNVGTLTSEHLSARGLLEAMLVLALLWWCWSGFAALGNILRADQGIMPLLGFAVMASVFVLVLATETAFQTDAGGLDGPFVFACAYLVTWAILVGALWTTVGPSWPARRRSLALNALTAGGTAIIIVGAVVPPRLFSAGTAHTVRLACWVVALLLQYAAGALVGRTGWRLRSVGHWAERHALIVLVALGESVIALGVGATNRSGGPITASLITAAILGIAAIAALWWLYFDVLAVHVEQVLHGVRGPARIPLARDVYTYLHLPLVVGIILFALGLERLLTAVIARPTTATQLAIGGLDLFILYGGTIVYVLTLVAIEARAARRLDPALIAAAGVLAVLIPVADRVPALTALALLTTAVLTLVGLQLVVKRRSRRQVRKLLSDEQAALETAVSQWRRRHL
ncbi:low temperature requirement protein A [Micromonospora sp. DT47]|uniref:low temperature requirement protein A n=1 Tax=Micromonospora sp. DT47 TaxID=3393431 RepID=UPI003CFA0531